MTPQETHVPPGRAGLGCILKSFYSLAGKLTLFHTATQSPRAKEAVAGVTNLVPPDLG